MEKNLKTLMVVAKIGKILSKIVWIFCLIGAIGCAVGIGFTALGIDLAYRLGGINIHGIVETASEMSLSTMYAGMTMGMIVCIGEVILAILAERYFNHVLAEGTPFTHEGADELFKLGVSSLIIPLCSTILAQVAYGIYRHIYTVIEKVDFDISVSLGLGLGFMLVSVILHYTASALEKKND